MHIARLLIVFSTVLGCCSGLICPEGCRCEDSPPYIANCSNVGLTDTPERFPNQTTLIDLSFNRITYLKENILGESFMEDLSKIILANNFIYRIERKTFYYEESLTEVDLSYNNINRFNSYIFKNNRLLVKLSFRGNRKLYLTYFGGFLISDSLRELDMSYCNIGRVPNNTFNRLPNIQRIDLSHNNITVLEPQSFAGLDNLNYLDISTNRLSSIVVDVLQSVLHLDQRTLKTEGESNKLNAIIAMVNLDDNPWTCDCEMKKVYEWCRSVQFCPKLVCVEPEELKHEPWDKLPEIEDCFHKAENKSEAEHFTNDPLVRFENYTENVINEYEIVHSASLVSILIIVASALSIVLSLMLMWIIYKDRRTPRNTIPAYISYREGNSTEPLNIKSRLYKHS